MVLCDTNILIEFYRGNADTAEALRRIGHADIAISVITQAELYFGARDKKELGSIRRHLSLVTCLPIDEAISKRFERLMASYSLSHRLAIPDALIAATAIERDLPLYTLNVRDFRFVEEIRLFVP